MWLASHEVRLPVLNKNRFFLLSLLSVPHLCCCFLSLSVFFFLSRLSKALIVCARQQGKCIVNSISLKVGEKEFKEHARLLKRLVTRYRHFSAIALLIVCFLSIMMSSFFLLRILLTVLLLWWSYFPTRGEQVWSGSHRHGLRRAGPSCRLRQQGMIVGL